MSPMYLLSLKQSKFSFCLDPDISMFSGRQYTEKNIFGMLADASPDRWGTNSHEAT